MELKFKMYLAADDGGGVLGEGRLRLLKQIGSEGSLRAAADKLCISYRKAWGDIRVMEQNLDIKLIQRRRGGKGGGASALTERAEKLIEDFELIKTELKTVAQKQFNQRLKKTLKKEI